ncbi:MAG TPA: hypothetical protein VL356_00345 [Acidocella sp.]|nr:hypothetical protein [Acidocella sp.]
MNKKKQKNFIDAGPWALALTTPMAQHPQKRSADSTIARGSSPFFTTFYMPNSRDELRVAGVECAA